MKFMTGKDIDRLRGDALRTTHLARYENAHNNEKAKCVLDVPCPDRGMPAFKQCSTN
jgi:hypothetical protein